MTNGEKLKEVFPDMESIVLHDTDESFVDTTLDGYSTFNLDWWEAEYKDPHPISKTEMSIDETRKILHDFLNSPYPVCGLDDAIKAALSTIEKMGQIERICKENCDWFTTRAIEKVKAVLGDRNDDCN